MAAWQNSKAPQRFNSLVFFSRYRLQAVGHRASGLPDDHDEDWTHPAGRTFSLPQEVTICLRRGCDSGKRQESDLFSTKIILIKNLLYSGRNLNKRYWLLSKCCRN
jgi:hypothetical protein